MTDSQISIHFGPWPLASSLFQPLRPIWGDPDMAVGRAIPAWFGDKSKRGLYHLFWTWFEPWSPSEFCLWQLFFPCSHREGTITIPVKMPGLCSPSLFSGSTRQGERQQESHGEPLRLLTSPNLFSLQRLILRISRREFLNKKRECWIYLLKNKQTNYFLLAR